jgi:hypothetical protein
MKEARNTSTSSRRQFLASAGIGGLFGSALGTSFLASERGSDHPTLTIYRSMGIFAMLIEHQSVRVLLLDGDADQSISEVTESVTGFLRQRLDVVLASDPVMRTISPEFVDRRVVSAVYALPDKQRPFTTPLDDRLLAIGDLHISAIALPLGVWRSGYAFDSRPWCVSVRYGSAFCVYSDSWDSLMAMGQPSGARVTLSVTNDSHTRVSEPHGLQIVAIPDDSMKSPAVTDPRSLPFRIVRLYRNYPTQIHLRPDSIILPEHG